jgi:hypothetical protein
MWGKNNTSVYSEDTEAEDAVINQTQFGEEKPLFEEPPVFIDNSAPSQTEEKKKPPFILILGGGFLALLVILSLGLALASKQTTLPGMVTPSPSPVLT